MIITNKLKERFCKDMNIPIKIFDEPYFTDRLELYDDLFNTKNKWKIFLQTINKFNSEQEYFEYYNSIKDDIINHIKSDVKYEEFNNCDMNMFSVNVKYRNITENSIFKPTFVGKKFISIDMNKGNFTAMNHFGLFENVSNYYEFISQFTDEEYIKNSKYIRQVVFGNCNPKRQTTYEKYLMNLLLFYIEENNLINKVVYFSNDEIIIDVTDYAYCTNYDLCNNIIAYSKELNINVKCEYFQLDKVNGTQGYKKIFLYTTYERTCDYEYKCLNSYEYPIVLRNDKHEEINDSDLTFVYEGKLARFI